MIKRCCLMIIRINSVRFAAISKGDAVESIRTAPRSRRYVMSTFAAKTIRELLYATKMQDSNPISESRMCEFHHATFQIAIFFHWAVSISSWPFMSSPDARQKKRRVVSLCLCLLMVLNGVV